MRTVQEIIDQAKLNVLANTRINFKPIESHSKEINPIRCNKSTGKDKYLKKQNRRMKNK